MKNGKSAGRRTLCAVLCVVIVIGCAGTAFAGSLPRMPGADTLEFLSENPEQAQSLYRTDENGLGEDYACTADTVIYLLPRKNARTVVPGEGSVIRILMAWDASWVAVRYQGGYGFVSARSVGWNAPVDAKAYTFELSGHVDSAVLDGLYEEWNGLPVSLREFILRKGWTVTVTDQDLNAKIDSAYGDRYVLGVVAPGEKKIYIWANQWAVDEASLSHELGHVLDYECAQVRPDFEDAYLSLSEEWKAAYQLEKDLHSMGTNTGDTASEFFAGLVHEILTGKGAEVEERLPGACALLSTHLKQYLPAAGYIGTLRDLTMEEPGHARKASQKITQAA